MVTDRERKIIFWLVRLRIWKMQSDGLWGRAIFVPMFGTRWILKRIKRQQISDGLHHAPACPANNWEMQVLVFQRCTCGAASRARKQAA